MKKLNYKNAEALADNIVRVIEWQKDIAVIAHYEIITELIKKLLIADDNILIGCVKLHDFDYSFYDEEFLLEIDDDKKIHVTPAFTENKGYLHIEADIVCVHADVCSSILKNINSKNIFEFSYEWEEDITASEEYINLSHDDNGELHGFTQSFSDENGYA